MNFGFSGEMLFLFFLALILFGPKKMPEIGRQVARFLNEFRRASNEFRSQIESEISSIDRSVNVGGGRSNPQILPPMQAPLGSLANRIFNPPPAEKLEAVEATRAAAAAEISAPEGAATVETGLAPSPAPKVAPDA
jgi:Sec-independent protein translocase protein TatA